MKEKEDGRNDTGEWAQTFGKEKMENRKNDSEGNETKNK